MKEGEVLHSPLDTGIWRVGRASPLGAVLRDWLEAVRHAPPSPPPADREVACWRTSSPSHASVPHAFPSAQPAAALHAPPRGHSRQLTEGAPASGARARENRVWNAYTLFLA